MSPTLLMMSAGREEGKQGDGFHSLFGYNSSQVRMRQLSPIRSHSPMARPKITFNYQPSPLKERPHQTNKPVPCSQPQPQMPIASPALLLSPKQHQMQVQAKQTVQKQGKCVCGKESTYKAVHSSKEYCSYCAVGQMKRGIQMNRIELTENKFYKDYQQKIEKENRSDSNADSSHERERESFRSIKPSLVKNEREREKQLGELLQQVANAYQGMDDLCQQLQSAELTQEGVKTLYRQKKMGLKQHYQRIKAAIKLSIEKDLLELDRQEEQSIQCIHQIKAQLDSDRYSLSSLRQQFTPQAQAGMLQLSQSQYRQKYEQWKAGIAQVHSQKQKAVHLVEQLSKHSGEDEQVRELELYDPNTYTLIHSRQTKGETLFSFQKRSD